MDVIVHGADTETLHGEPMTLQFFSDDMPECTAIYDVDASDALRSTIDWLDRLRTHVKHVVYCHNLDFDLPEFLWGMHSELIQPGNAFDFTSGNWRFHGVYGKPTFCHAAHTRKNISVLFVDSFLWFQGSLARAAELFCPGLPKLKRPKDLGTRKYSMHDSDFCEYAMRDAEVAYHIGKAVQRIHSEFDIMQSVSLADMSSKIFRHHFLDYTIPRTNRDIAQAALFSYHGGKNNVITNAAPMWHTDIAALDISSAYPYAMSQLPSFGDKRLYKRYAKARRCKSVPPFGVYNVSGTAADCEWPCIFDHSFTPIRGADFSRVWIQGIELNEALASGEIKINSIRGYYYDHERDNREPAFAKYVREFYTRKENERDKVQRHMWKTILNSVYGKFIQTHKNATISYTDIETMTVKESQEVVAGGMFHPFIATAITAHTRAYIHQIEHAHKAIHTATDGIYTRYKRPKRVAMASAKGLGSLQIEGTGDLLLIRNKCYILYSKGAKMKSFAFRGKRIAKYALHGFQGSVYDLEKLVASNRRKYTVNRPNRLRESLKRGLRVNEFVKRDYTLKVGPIGVASR